MKRRDFIGLVGAAAAFPLPLGAQQPQQPRRIAFVHSGIPVDRLTEAAGPSWVRSFYEELRRLGLTEGTNLVVERFSAEGSSSRYPALVAEVVARKPEVIVSITNVLTKTFATATATIPIVAITTDPVAAGLVTSLARPGGNLTGASVVAGPDIVGKRLQILKDALPAAAKVAYLMQNRLQWQAGSAASLRDAGQRLGIAVAGVDVPEVSEAQLQRAFAEMAEQKFDAAILDESGIFGARRAAIIALADKYRLPMMYAYRDYAEFGGFLAYGADLSELYRRVASDVQLILNGAKAGDIPYYQPTKFQLVINMKTAKALGVTVPPTLLAIADEVFE